MGYCGMVYRVSFKRLGALCGSRAQQLINRLSPDLAGDNDLDDDEDALQGEPWLSSSEALRRIIMGDSVSPNDAAAYGMAMIALYRYAGYPLDNAPLAPADWQHILAVDAALAAEGVPEAIRLSRLLSGGLPILGLPSPEPFPTLGYIPPEAVATGRAWHKGFRWFRYPPELHPPIQFLHRWLQEAAGEEQGLVGYYA